MKANRIALLVAAALVAGCSKDGGPFLAPVQPLAFVRYVNAIPDTFSLTWRPIDAIENSPEWIGGAFRGSQTYRAMAPGPRHLRIFPHPGGDAPDVNVVSQIVHDETITFEANKYYTLIHVGHARDNTDRIVVLEDVWPDNIGSQVAFRVVNVSPDHASIDASVTAASGDAIPATAEFGGVEFGEASSYVLRAPGTAWLRVTSGGTEIISGNARQAPAGNAGDPTTLLDPVGGAALANSAITAFVFSRSVAGSTAPQTTAFQTPTVVFLVDKHPPRPTQ
jgi:hypothetical protein